MLVHDASNSDKQQREARMCGVATRSPTPIAFG